MWGYGVARRKKKIRIFYSIVWRKSFFTDWHACWRRTMRIRLTYPQWAGAKKLRRADLLLVFMYQEALQLDAATIQAAGVRAMVNQTLCQAALVQQKSWSGIVVAMKCWSLDILLEKL